MNEIVSLPKGEDEVYLDTTEELLQLVGDMLAQPRLSEDMRISAKLQQYEQFQALYVLLQDLRTLSATLAKGDLQEMVSSKGFVLANLKALQAHLRHLTWQTKEVAKGDFSQRVEFLGEFSDSFNEMIEKLERFSEQMRRLARLDVLTQIPNRRVLMEFLHASFQEAKKYRGELSILMMDLDLFKTVNDTYGHAVGDKVLVKISHVLNKQFRSTDIFARYGGEEFVAALPGAGESTARAIAQRALNAVRETVVKLDSGDSVRITVSIGVSSMREEDKTYQDIMLRSDHALYAAKFAGRNRVCVE